MKARSSSTCTTHIKMKLQNMNNHPIHSRMYGHRMSMFRVYEHFDIPKSSKIMLLKSIEERCSYNSNSDSNSYSGKMLSQFINIDWNRQQNKWEHRKIAGWFKPLSEIFCLYFLFALYIRETNAWQNMPIN